MCVTPILEVECQGIGISDGVEDEIGKSVEM
jgi:hypothetical protein